MSENEIELARRYSLADGDEAGRNKKYSVSLSDNGRFGPVAEELDEEEAGETSDEDSYRKTPQHGAQQTTQHIEYYNMPPNSFGTTARVHTTQAKTGTAFMQKLCRAASTILPQYIQILVAINDCDSFLTRNKVFYRNPITWFLSSVLDYVSDEVFYRFATDSEYVISETIKNTPVLGFFIVFLFSHQTLRFGLMNRFLRAISDVTITIKYMEQATASVQRYNKVLPFIVGHCGRPIYRAFLLTVYHNFTDISQVSKDSWLFLQVAIALSAWILHRTGLSSNPVAQLAALTTSMLTNAFRQRILRYLEACLPRLAGHHRDAGLGNF